MMKDVESAISQNLFFQIFFKYLPNDVLELLILCLIYPIEFLILYN